MKLKVKDLKRLLEDVSDDAYVCLQDDFGKIYIAEDHVSINKGDKVILDFTYISDSYAAREYVENQDGTSQKVARKSLFILKV